MGRHSDRLKLSQIKALVAVADYQSFSRAADELDLSQSSISHAIAGLEAELGISLFSRGRHGAQLTPVGERILIQARTILAALDQVTQEADLVRGLAGGSVRVAAFRSLATSFLPQAIAQFSQQFPSITVSLVECTCQDEVEQVLQTKQADIGLLHLPSSPELETWELFRDEFLVILPPDSSHAGTHLSWEEIAQYPMILSPEKDCCDRMIIQHFDHHQHSIQIASYEVREASTILGMVRQGLGGTVMHGYEIESFVSDFQVFPLPVPLERINGCAVLKDALHLPATFTFLETLKSTCRASSISEVTG
ncbi:MAG: LysR family transcriptional regulator [Cyanobacteria bacterium J06635_15]